MKAVKSTAHLGESWSLLGLLLVACLGIVLIVTMGSAQF